MTRAREGMWVVLAVAALWATASGCGKESTVHYETYWTRSERADAGAFARVEKAALDAEQAGEKYLSRLSFTPGERQDVVDALSPALSRLAAALSQPAPFAFQSRGPFEEAPLQRGWRLLGRALVWKIERALSDGDTSAAARWAVVGTRFGLELTGGGASDASLGFTIIREVRRALAPSMADLQSADLASLSAGLSRALDSRPPFATLVDHEAENMMAAVEAVQEAYRRDDLKPLRELLGSDGPTATEYLQSMKSKDREERPGYFQNLAADARDEVAWLRSVGDLPGSKRSSPPEDSEGPWRRFSRHFFRSVRPLLEVRDRELARTRLFALEAGLIALVKKTRSAPRDLRGFPEGLRLDPFSGQEFRYSATGADYRLYSVGADFRDDGGVSDEQSETPDLLLER